MNREVRINPNTSKPLKLFENIDLNKGIPVIINGLQVLPNEDAIDIEQIIGINEDVSKIAAIVTDDGDKFTTILFNPDGSKERIITPKAGYNNKTISKTKWFEDEGFKRL